MHGREARLAVLTFTGPPLVEGGSCVALKPAAIPLVGLGSSCSELLRFKANGLPLARSESSCWELCRINANGTQLVGIECNCAEMRRLKVCC